MRVRLELLLLVFFIAACTGEPETGPVKVRWDREICPRCAMVVSDHNYTAQVRGGPVDKKKKVYTFDDIGCAVIWLDNQPWKEDQGTEIWVTDHRNGEWIDARTARYVTGKITPMAYGLGAQNEPAENSLSFTEAIKHIYAVEAAEHQHAGDVEHVQGIGE